MDPTSVAVVAQRTGPAMAAVGASTAHDAKDAPKIRISKIGGRFLVFDLADVARLRREHSMCAVLVGITPQAPNQSVFSGLPLELAPDEVRWLVQDRAVAYVADDVLAHVASLASASGRRSYKASLLRQRQVVQADEDRLAVERARHGAEVRARIAAKKAEKKSQAGSGKSKNNKGGEDAKAAGPGACSCDAGPAGDDVKEGDAPFVVKEKGTAVVTAAADGTTARAEETRDMTGESDKVAKAGKAVAPSRTQPRVRFTPTTSVGLVGDDDHDYAAGSDTALIPQLLPPPVSFSATALRAHLADQGYYTTPGLRFGGKLSVYPGDPFRYHAHFVATAYEWDEPIPVLDIVSAGRLATGVKKGLLIGGAKPKDPEESATVQGRVADSVRAFTLEWAAI